MNPRDALGGPINRDAQPATGSKLMQVCSLIQDLGFRDLKRLATELSSNLNQADLAINGDSCAEALVDAAERINPKGAR